MCYTFRLCDTYESIKNRCAGIDDENEDNEGEDFDYFFHKRVRETYEGEEKAIAKRAVKDADHHEDIARKEFESLTRKDMECGIEKLAKGIETLCELFPEQTPAFSDYVQVESIRTEQESADLCIKTGSFRRLVREIFCDFKTNLRVVDEACDILQHVSEQYLIDYFQAGNFLAVKDGRDCLTTSDLQTAFHICNRYDIKL